MKTGVRAQVNALGVYTYFDYLARLLKANPPKAADADIVARMAKIGIVPGRTSTGARSGLSTGRRSRRCRSSRS